MTGVVVVGVDDSEGARAALRWAARQSTVTGARLKVVHVFELSLAWIDAYDPALPVWADRAREVAEATVARVVRDVLGPDPVGPVESVEIEGDAAESLREAARDADLLVVGSRGRGGFAGLLLGSVGQRIVQHPPCPVVVVPRAEATTPG